MSRAAALLLAVLLAAGCQQPPHYDVLITNGQVYDGLGAPAVQASVAIADGKVVAVGAPEGATADLVVDAAGQAVAPGFINMLSWADEPLLVDGRSQSDIRQGVTLEVFGEGWSMGPLSDVMRQGVVDGQGDLTFPVTWSTLGGYFETLERQGISPNVASFVGATTVRIHEVGYADREPTTEELARMKDLVREGMRDGALGVGSSLIYAPAFYAKTPELIELSRAAAESGGMYISHMRSEGAALLEAIDELITIAREAGVPAEIYHFKAAGRDNWDKVDAAIAKVEAARAEGLRITADMYTYPAGATGLNATMPPWVQEGGYEQWVARMKDPAMRARLRREMATPTAEWENFFTGAGPDGILLVGFKSEALKPLTGKTLAEVAAMRGTSPADTAMDLVIEDGSRVEAVYFLMSEDNLRRQLRLPWVSLASDAGSIAPEGPFLLSNPHPRAYGNFARWLGRYVRDEQLVPLAEGIRRLTSLPADNLGLADRGRLTPGAWADVVVFDPATIADHATFEAPHQYATGVRDVFVNGVAVLRDGEHTGATPGRAVRGPGYAASR
ncbi:MAG: amidohydrolase family protein [Vicinamibacterales bacterium]